MAILANAGFWTVRCRETNNPEQSCEPVVAGRLIDIGQPQSDNVDQTAIILDMLAEHGAASTERENVHAVTCGNAAERSIRLHGETCDTPVAQEMRMYINELAENLTRDMLWEQSTMAIVDNRRVLHGRPAWDDENRDISTRLCLEPLTP